MMESKMCCQCKTSQLLNNFSHFFVKQRNKFRVSSHCKSCASLNTRKYYQDNREKCIASSKLRKLSNPEHTKKVKKEISERYKNDLHITYVKQCLRLGKFSDDFIDKNPQVIENKRLQIKLKRKLKQINNGKKQVN